MEIKVHPNYGTSVVLVDDAPYYWDGDLCIYREGYGTYSQTTMIGDWRLPTHREAITVRESILADDGSTWDS